MSCLLALGLVYPYTCKSEHSFAQVTPMSLAMWEDGLKKGEGV